jgi:FSR family fosmidomycin resistance protein-like MFS transporter
MSVKDVAMAMAAASLTYTFLQPLAGKVADKIDKRVLILIASIPFIPVISTFGFLHQLNEIVISMTLFGVLGGFIFPASNSLIGVIAPEGMENIYSGFYNMMLSLGVTVSPIVLGILSDTLGYGYAYISNGVLMSIVLILFLALWREFRE